MATFLYGGRGNPRAPAPTLRQLKTWSPNSSGPERSPVPGILFPNAWAPQRLRTGTPTPSSPRPRARSPAAPQPGSPAAATGGTKETGAFPAARTTDANTPPAPHHTPPSRPRPARQPAHEQAAAAAAAGCGERAVRTSDWCSPPRVTGSRLLVQTGVPVRSARASPRPAFRRPPALAASPSPQFAGREVAAAARRQR